MGTYHFGIFHTSLGSTLCTKSAIKSDLSVESALLCPLWIARLPTLLDPPEPVQILKILASPARSHVAPRAPRIETRGPHIYGTHGYL